MTLKYCGGCGRWLERGLFNARQRSLDGLQTQCKACNSNRQKNRSREDKDRENSKHRARKRQRMWVKGLSDRYGMTAQEYDLLLESQNGQCAMCGTDNPGPVRTGGVDRKFSVDHDHETGKVRAILCSKCNTGLGMLGDNPAEAAAMLLSYSKLVNPIDADYF